MKIVVAYSGGLDTSTILNWLKNEYQAEVIAYCADVGQAEELDGLKNKALKTGASKCYIDDLKETFAKDYIFPMFQGNALYENRYLLGTSIARPCITKGLIEVAKKENATAIAHGATGKGNDQIRFELSATSLAPNLQIIAPWRLEHFRKQFPGRQEMINYAQAYNIPIQASTQKPYSMDRNLLHISFEAGALEDPWVDATTLDDTYVMTAPLEKTHDKPEYLQLLFEQGVVIGISHQSIDQIIAELGDITSLGRHNDYQLLSPYGVMRVLNAIGYTHGIGRIDIVENRFVGMKSRGIYETPGGTLLLAAHLDLESITLDKEVLALKSQLIPQYAQMIYNGFWFAPEREAIQALITQTQAKVSGEVRLKIYKGQIHNAGRRSPYSLYSESLATMEGGYEDDYNQNDASGFIKLQGLRLKKNFDS